MDHIFSHLIRVEDAATETFELFASSRQHGSDLGMLAPSESIIELSIMNHDLIITQSPGLLRSDHAQGTTGAAAWQSGVRFARWLALPANALLKYGIVHSGGTVMELGSGVAGIVSSIIAAKLVPAGKVIASDMEYALRLLRQNIAANRDVITASNKHRARARMATVAQVEVVPFNWEEDDAASLLRGLGLPAGVDIIVACDCIYNYALLKPFVDSCAAICAMRDNTDDKPPTSCLIVQHLRQSDIFQEWMDMTLPLFHIWRLPSDMLCNDLDEDSGFAVHLLRLR